MPEAATIEFWKDIRPIANVFQPDALRELYTSNTPTCDERL